VGGPQQQQRASTRRQRYVQYFSCFVDGAIYVVRRLLTSFFFVISNAFASATPFRHGSAVINGKGAPLFGVRYGYPKPA